MVGVDADRFVFSARWRVAAVVYVVATVSLAVVVGASARGQGEFLTVRAWVVCVCVVPAVLAAPRALRRVGPGDRLTLGLWCVGWAVVYGGNLVVYLIGVRGWEHLGWVLGVSVVVCVLAFGIGNSLALHRRSGQRLFALDLVDLLLAVVAVVGPVALLVAEPIVTAPHPWLAVASSVVSIGLVHGIVALVLIGLRVPRGRRGLVVLVVAFLVAALGDAAGLVAQEVRGYSLPSGPLMGLFAVVMSGGALMTVFALRSTSPGLDRLPPQGQVRKTGPLAVLVLVSVGLMAVEVLLARDRAWVVNTAIGLLVVLVALSTLRHLCLGRETVRLYGEVERAADERRELLAEVMRYVDSDHHRAAAHLHRQASALYVTMASFAEADVAAQRIRLDLGQQVDASDQILRAIGPSPAEGEGLDRLVALTRAYVGILYGDIRRPELAVSIDDRLVIDWTHEVVAFRIVQVAVHNVWRHAQASRIGVSLTAPDGTLVVEVCDDGVGFEPASLQPGTGIVTMRSLVGYVHGHVDVDSSPGAGTRVCAVVGPAAPVSGRRPGLRLVRSAGPPPAGT